MEYKICIKCNSNKHLSEFRVRRDTKTFRYYGTCKKCETSQNRLRNNEKYKNSEEFRNKRKECKRNRYYFLKEEIYKKYGFHFVKFKRYGKENVLEVLRRANNKCENCGSEKKLCIHHKDGNGLNLIRKGLKANNDIDNLQVLCVYCHRRLHMKKEAHIYWERRRMLNNCV